MNDLMLFAEGLLSKQRVIEEFGIPKNLERKLFAILKPRLGKLYFKKDVEPTLEKVLGVNRPPFADDEFSYEKEDLKVNGVGQLASLDGPWNRIAVSLEQLVEVLLPQVQPVKPVNVMLTPAEAAKQMKLHIQTVRQWCREGKLGVKAGRKWLISPDEVKQYLRGQLLINGKVAG